MAIPYLPRPYYVTKDEEDWWTVHGVRHHLLINRSEGPSGRLDRNDEDILQVVYYVTDKSGKGDDPIIDLDRQFDGEPHGFTRLKDAAMWAFYELRRAGY